MSAPPILTVEDISFRYGGRPTLSGISAAFGRGEIVGLVGPNGAGKSTLVRCMLGMLRPLAGRVLMHGRDVRDIPPRDRARLLAYVPQASPPAFPMTVFETCLLGRTPHMRTRPSQADTRVVEDILRRLELEDFAFRLLSELSGGERQRVMLARALIQETEILVLDEPTSALDIRNQLFTLRLVGELARERDITAVIAIHDLALAARFSTRIILLEGGRIRQSGTWCTTLTEASIRDAYGVGTHVTTYRERPVFVPYELGR